jgi:hypothetical protein
MNVYMVPLHTHRGQNWECICAECNNLLGWEQQDDKSNSSWFQPANMRLFCVNPKCSQHNIRYKPPLVALERA